MTGVTVMKGWKKLTKVQMMLNGPEHCAHHMEMSLSDRPILQLVLTTSQRNEYNVGLRSSGCFFFPFSHFLQRLFSPRCYSHALVKRHDHVS